MPVSAQTRERIRRNVGYPHRAVLLHPPGAVGEAGLFQPTRLILPPGAPKPIPVPAPLTFAGHSIVLTAQTPGATREIKASDRLGYAAQLRQILVMGTWAITDAISLRLLVSDDNDETATADPTGDDIIDFRGDVVGAADRGLFFGPNTGPLLVEPWTRIGLPGKYLKAKLHNATAGSATWAVYFDLDELTG